MANFNVLKAAYEDLPNTWLTLKNDVPGTGVDVKISVLNQAFVSYCDDSDPKNVKVIYTNDLGENWSSPVTVEADVEDCQTAIAFDAINNVYVFFVKDFSGTNRIAYRKSSDAGATWGDLQDTGVEADV